MTDPVSDLVVCRQRLDVLEQQAKAATEGEWAFQDDGSIRSRLRDGDRVLVVRFTWPQEASHIAAWSPSAVLAWCEWIRQVVDGAEATISWHCESTKWADVCAACEHDWPCSDYRSAASVIAGLAAVLAPEQAVKP